MNNNNTLLAILSAIFVLGGSWLLSRYTSCGSGGASNATQFSILDGELKTNPTDAFTFGFSGMVPTVSKSTQGELKKVADHLKNNDTRELNLVGTYYSSEQAKGGTDLGLARAEAIKDKLIALGAPSESITTASRKLNNVQAGTVDVLHNPVDFSFTEKKTDEVSDTSVEPVGEVSIFEPYTLRFPTGVSEPEMTTELRSYLDRALQYIQENPSNVLMVTGYTDDVGSSSGNISLSKNRARKVRRFLRNNGVASAQVVAQGKGEADPVADNGTDEGKAMNRRVEITLQDS